LKPILSGCDKRSGDDIIFDVQGLSKYLGVSHKWVYERAQFKEIPHIKVKGLLRFRKDEIDRWLERYNVPCVQHPGRIPDQRQRMTGNNP